MTITAEPLRRMALALCVFLLVACNRRGDSTGTDEAPSLPTRGRVTLYADESFQPLLSNAVTMFHTVYRDAHVNIHYTDEAEVLTRFLNFDARVVFLARRLTDAELKNHADRGFQTQHLRIAADAVALVVNAGNPDSLITYENALGLLGGDIAGWSSIRNTNQSGRVAVVFQKSNSSTASFIRDSVLNGKPLPPNSYALESHAAVLDYVRENPGAMGVLALNWISDRHDPAVEEALRGLRVVAVSLPGKTDLFYKPTRSHLRQGLYPFWRAVYVVNAEGRSGLGTGFASYLASDKGMTIVERFGLVPAREPVRIIETRKSFN